MPIKPEVPAVERFARAGARVAEDRQHRRQKKRHGQKQADDRFEGGPEKTFPGHMPVGRRGAEGKIDQHKDDLADEKPVVDERIDGDSQRKHAAPVVDHQLLKADQKKREEDDRFVKVIEKDIVNGKSAERIEQTAENSIGTRRYKPLEIERAGRCRTGVLENQKRADQMRNKFSRER